jgi:hypothetical protein
VGHLRTQHAWGLFTSVPDLSNTTLEQCLDNAHIEIPASANRIYRKVYKAAHLARSPRNRRPVLPGLAVPGLDFEVTPAWVVQEYQRLVRERDALVAEQRWLTNREQDLSQQLEGVTHTRGLWPGVGVLIYFCLSGILIPVAYLPADPLRFKATHKWAFFVLFASGLISVFVYLVWSIRWLTAPPKG